MIFITGVPGWLGNRFLHFLIKGFSNQSELVEKYANDSIRCLVIDKTHIDLTNDISNRINCVVGDVRDRDTLSDFFQNSKGATLFHLAGIIHPNKKIKDLYDINSNGVRNILDIAYKSGIKRAIIVSSNSPIGCNPHNKHIFDESASYNPYMNYGKSKKLCEDITNEYYKAGKIETVIIRPCWFYGPEQPERQTLFFNMIKEGKMPIVGDGNNMRSMSYVDNTCQGLLLADQVDSAKGQTYWIADERPYSMNEIIDTVKNLLETEFHQVVSRKKFILPSFTSDIAFIADNIIQGFGLYNQKIHVLSEMNKTIACSINKAKRELNYDPYIQLEEGMRRSIRWCMDKGYIH